MNRHAILAIVLCAAAALLVVGLEMQRRTRSAAPAATVPAAAIESTQTIANVADAVRTLKLVTWQFETTISAQSVSDKWYGDAVARVRAPVRYQYGVDLERLRHEDVLLGSDGASYVFLVPPPERIAVEVDVAKLEQELRVSGARWRSQNGDRVDSARTKLAAVAEKVELSPGDEKRLREVSREQLERHLSNVVKPGGEARVIVRFAD